MADEQEASGWGEVGALTKEAVEAHRANLGTNYATASRITHGCEDLITMFADALGDPNPLWRDAEYARKTRYGSIVAPPYFLASFAGGRQHGLRGVYTIMAGNSWEFYKPVFPGDRITSDYVFAELEEKSGGFAPYWLMEHHDSRFYNQKGEVVGLCRSSSGRVEMKYIGRGSVGKAKTEEKKEEKRPEGGGGKIQLPHPWTLEELAQIEDEMLAEPIRGSEPRYFEDIQEGEDLPILTKGPLRISDVVIWVMTVPPPWRAFALGVKELRAKPGLAFIHPESRAREQGGLQHFDRISAQSSGFPYAYAYGTQEFGWFTQHLTDWIADNGWLKKITGQYRKFVYISDVNRFHSKVVKKYFDDQGEACVDIDTTVINQRGEKTLIGDATVILPSRERGTNPVEKRLAAQ